MACDVCGSCAHQHQRLRTQTTRAMQANHPSPLFFCVLLHVLLLSSLVVPRTRAQGTAAGEDACVDTPDLLCTEAAIASLCTSSDPEVARAIATHCPSACGACREQRQSARWFCVFPPSTNPDDRCTTVSEATCQLIPLGVCTALAPTLSPLLRNNFVLLNAVDETTVEWSFHFSDLCVGSGIISGTRNTGQTALGSCHALVVDFVGHVQNMAFYEQCEGEGETFSCSGDGLACIDSSHTTQERCPTNRCRWIPELELCYNADAEPFCYLYDAQTCPAGRCAFDAYTSTCMPDNNCFCSERGTSGGFPVRPTGCTLGSNETEWPEGRYGCYLDDGAAQNCECSQPSARFPGAAWRECTVACPAYRVDAQGQLGSLLTGDYVNDHSETFFDVRTPTQDRCLMFPLVRKLAADKKDQVYFSSNVYSLDVPGTPIPFGGFWFFLSETQRLTLAFAVFNDQADVSLSAVTDLLIAFTPSTVPQAELIETTWTSSAVTGFVEQVPVTLACQPLKCPSVTDIAVRRIEGGWNVTWSPVQSRKFVFEQLGRVVSVVQELRVSRANVVEFERPAGLTHVLLTEEDVRPYARLFITIRTNGSNCLEQESPVFSFLTARAAPSAPPSDLSVEAINATALLVTWTPPPVDQLNGIPRTYLVQWRRQTQRRSKRAVDDGGNTDTGTNNTVVYTSVILPATAREFTIGDLQPFGVYLVQVAVSNDLGTGPFVVVQSQTGQAIPSEAPAITSTRRVSSSTAEVSWSPIRLDSLNGVLTGYVIRLYLDTSAKQTSTETNSKQQSNEPKLQQQATVTQQDGAEATTSGASVDGLLREIVVSPLDTVVTISNLDGGSTYRVAVAARTVPGPGPFSEPARIGPPSSESSDSLGAGAIFGTIIAVLAVCALLVFLVLRRRKDDQKSASPESEQLQESLGGLEEFEIPFSCIRMKEEIGQGQFGSVLEGEIVMEDSGIHQDVAVKMLRHKLDPMERALFIEEAERMVALDHPNVVRLLGVCFRTEPNVICVELCSLGDLQKYLRKNRAIPERAALLSTGQLVEMAFQVCCGLQYLQSIGYAHRDIAARNVLITDTGTLKLGDFGMARSLLHQNYYRKTGSAMLPLRWMAPESIVDGVFTLQSDIFAFGTLLWEIFSFANLPWGGLADEQVIEAVSQKKKRLPCPPACPPALYTLMMQCWEHDPVARITCDELHARLASAERPHTYFALKSLSQPRLNEKTATTLGSALSQRLTSRLRKQRVSEISLKSVPMDDCMFCVQNNVGQMAFYGIAETDGDVRVDQLESPANCPQGSVLCSVRVSDRHVSVSFAAGGNSPAAGEGVLAASASGFNTPSGRATPSFAVASQQPAAGQPPEANYHQLHLSVPDVSVSDV